MPKTSKPINDVYSTVTRPVAFSAIRRIAALCGWDLEQQELIFRGKAVQPRILAGLEFAPNTADNEVKGPGDGFLSIELAELPEDNAVMYDTVFKRNALPVFMDPKLGVSLVPAYATMNATLSITRRFQDQPSAERWWYDMKRLVTQEHGASFLSADYSYVMPVQMLWLLKEIHTRREAIGGYGDSFGQYLGKGFDERASTETNVKGDGESKTIRLTIREHQDEISGFFDFGDAPKPEKVDNTGAWDVSFGYRYTYDAPTHIVARYPMQVHQQVMPEEFLNKPTYSARDPRKVRRGGMAVQYQDRLRAQFIPIMNRYETVFKYPEEDEWTPSIAADAAIPATTLYTGLCAVDSTMPKVFFGFDEWAENAELHPELKQWFLDYPQWMSTFYYSPIYLEIWKDNVVYNRETWGLDEHQNLSATNDLDLRSTYRIRMALLNDLSHLQEEALKALCSYPTLVSEMLVALGLPKAEVPKPNLRNVISYVEFMAAIRKLPKTAQWFRQRKDIIIPQVMIGSIIGVKSHGVKR